MLLGFSFCSMSTVLLKRARKRELTKLMTNHIFGDEHSIENFAIMHVKRQPNKIRCDRGTARPSLNWLFALACI